MSKAKRLLLAVAAAAMALTVSCFPDGGSESIGTCGGKEYDPAVYSCERNEIVGYCMGQTYYPEYQHCENGEVTGGTAISSSSGGRSSGGGDQSSSSGVAQCEYPPGDPRCGGGQPSSSSRQNGTVYGTSVTYGGETYQTVVIGTQWGTQTWFAKNLNYNEEGSVCYDDDPANCATYGRLYNWATAMNLPSSCNENTCSSQIQSPHKGICPSGWHIPSNADWDILFLFVDTQNGGRGEGILPYNSYTAGKHLKATSGWNGGNGTDTYGFSALPGGYGYSGGRFGHVGYSGHWWSASEYRSNFAYSRYMHFYYYERAGWDDDIKSYPISVRCLQD